MRARELYTRADQETVEIKVPSFRELIALDDAPQYITKNRERILRQSEHRYGSKTDLPPGVYRFNLKESPAYDIQWVPSPHYNSRPGGRIDMLILHYTVTSRLQNTVAWFQNPAAKVSAHYVVGKDGNIVQMVRDEHRAWHAGISHWNGEAGCNDFSLGIEIVNEGENKGIPYTPRQYEAIIYLCKRLIDRYHIESRRIQGHSDISPYRKIDPGRFFNWELLHKNRIGFMPVRGPAPAGQNKNKSYHGPEGPALTGGFTLRAGDNDRKGVYQGEVHPPGEFVRDLQSDLRKIGYHITIDGDFGPKTKAVVEAFQRHYLPNNITGVVNSDTALMIKEFFRSVKA